MCWGSTAGSSLSPALAAIRAGGGLMLDEFHVKHEHSGVFKAQQKLAFCCMRRAVGRKIAKKNLDP